MSRIRIAASVLVAVLLLALAASPAAADPGDLDPTYRNDGTSVVPFDGGNSSAQAAARLPDGGVVLAGAFVGTPDLALARLRLDGRPHKGFGSNGRVVADSGASDEFFAGVAVQGDRILAVAQDVSGDPDADVAVMAFGLDGSPDTSFGVGAIAMVDFGGRDFGEAIAVDGDGRVLIAAGVYPPPPVGAPFAMGVARLTPNGAVDTRFANNGRRRILFPEGDSLGNAYPYDIVVRPGGGVAVAGTTYNSDRRVAVAALTANGSLDPSFGDGGRFTYGVGGEDAEGFALAQKQGKLLVAGRQGGSGDTDGLVLRLTVGGSLDPLFGDGGVTRVPLSPGEDVFNGIAVLPGGRFVAAGNTDEVNLGPTAIVRLTAGVDLDPTFGQGGVSTLTELASIEDVVVDGTGRPLVAGRDSLTVPFNMAAARFLV